MFRLFVALIPALGFALVLGMTPSAQAWGLFGCHHGACDTTVNIPPQQVTIETAAPRVSIHQSHQLARAPIAPAIGAVYMPMAFPVAGVGYGASYEAGACRGEEEYNPLQTAHAAELHQMRFEKARQALDVEIQAKGRILKRMASPMMAVSETAPPVNTDLKNITAKMESLCDRLSSLEKLVQKHDDYLQNKIKNEPKPTPAEQLLMPQK